MGVQARFLANGPYCEPDDTGVFRIYKHDNVYLLPRIELEPEGNNLPHIFQLSIRAEDAPPSLKQAMYDLSRSKFTRIPNPVLLKRRQLLTDLSLSATTEVADFPQCSLVLEVNYYRSDADGYAITNQPKNENFRIPVAFERYDEPSEKKMVEIRVDPQTLKMTVGGEPATLRIEVVDGPGPAPTMALSHSTEIPHETLRKQLMDALGAPLLPLAPGEDGSQIWEAKLAIELPDTIEQQLWPEPESPPITVEVSTQAGEASYGHELRIYGPERHSKPLGPQFPGWVALDFGTSNSTVTLFDPKVVKPMKGLPREPRIGLQKTMTAWFQQGGPDAMPGKNAKGILLCEEWQKLLEEIGKILPGGTGLDAVIAPFRSGDVKAMDNILRQIELWLLAASVELQRAVRRRLQRIYHDVFRVPSLRDLHLVPVELERASGRTEILSEAEVVALDPLKLELGQEVKNRRLDAIAREGVNDSGRFHKMLKSLLGTNRGIDIRVGDEVRSHQPAESLIQAAWGHLFELTDQYRERNPSELSAGPIRHAIITYPTISPPSVRRNIEKITEALNIVIVETSYDEAVSAAIFFLMREFGATLDIGLEAFKARCRRHKNRWLQNVLVFDIGGGTTDMALIRLTLEEVNPFGDNEDRGAGGRYYVMTPELLGSSGHMQLGGELATLRTFLLLKATIADHLLTLAGPDGGPLAAQLSSLDKPFIGADGHYVPGSVVEHVLSQDDIYYSAALDAAEAIIPTRWKQDSKRLQSFYTLWEHAEEAKIHLGGRREPDASETMIFELDSAKVQDILDQVGIKFDGRVEQDLGVTLDQSRFEQIVAPDIQEAVKIAKGLLESRLPLGHDSRREPLEWLILSGKTCNLALVEREIRRAFANVDYFVWNPDRVTFDPQFAKLSTSIGACYAEFLRQFAFNPRGAIPLLKKGLNQLYFDVKNLFFFLPCSFTRIIAAAPTERVFNAGTELYQIDSKPLGKARSRWSEATLQTTIMRQDYDGGDQHIWGNFPGGELAKKLGFSADEWMNQIMLQLEINQKLEIKVYLCRGLPHYEVSPGVSPDISACLDIEQSLKKTASDREETEAELPPSSGDGRLPWDICVAPFVGGVPNMDGLETIIFKAGEPYKQTFHSGPDDEEVIHGIISKPLPEFFRNDTHAFYGRHAGNDNWVHLGNLSRPGAKSDFPRQYRVTLDERGRLRIHAGEVPYWTSTKLQSLKSTEGHVYQQDLILTASQLENARDPFNGTH